MLLKWHRVRSGHVGKSVDVHSALSRQTNSTFAAVHHVDWSVGKADVARTASICRD